MLQGKGAGKALNVSLMRSMEAGCAQGCLEGGHGGCVCSLAGAAEGKCRQQDGVSYQRCREESLSVPKPSQAESDAVTQPCSCKGLGEFNLSKKATWKSLCGPLK